MPRRAKDKIPPELAAHNRGSSDWASYKQSRRGKLSEYLLYKEKYGESHFESLSAVMNGDLEKLFQLIKWDKNFLYEDVIKTIILEKDLKEDRDFFSKLGDAIKVFDDKPADYEGLVIWLGTLVDRSKVLDSATWPELIKDLLAKALLEYQNLPEDHPFEEILSDRRQLLNFIKRHKFRIFNPL